MARKPPTRKYRKKKPGTDPVLPPPGQGRLLIRQIRSQSGHPPVVRRTLAALGLRHHQDQVVQRDHPAIRGMLYRVRHLVRVTPAQDGE
jgi:large subunit ribosomal protein L30